MMKAANLILNHKDGGKRVKTQPDLRRAYSPRSPAFYPCDTTNSLPAYGKNHRRTHRIEFNERMGRWICGCGWKSEPICKRSSRLTKPSASPDKNKEHEGFGPHPPFTHCVVCNYESAIDFGTCPRCKTKGMAVI